MVTLRTSDLTREAEAEEHTEGRVAHFIENQTAKVPSDLFLWAAIGAMGYSAYAYYRGNQEQSAFVGQWAPSFLLLGIYNKLVKQQGSDSTDRSHKRR
jgi:hypothetical protein